MKNDKISLVLYSVARIVVPILPFIMIGGNFFIMMLLIAIGFIFPITTPVFWIWGLVCAIRGVQDIWAIIFYVAFVLLFVPFIFNVIRELLRK